MVATMSKRTQRTVPVLRMSVMVRGRSYEVLVSVYDADAPLLVASASQPGFWVVDREEYTCACPAFDWRRTCAHVEAARLVLKP